MSEETARRRESPGGLDLRRLGAAASGRLTLLCASLRVAGVRLGVGELVAAHRALAAVDTGSRRDVYLALRAVLCSRHADLEAFDAGFEAVFGTLELPPPSDLPDVASMALPRAGVPGGDRRPPAAEEALEPVAVPSAWSEEELLHEKDFAVYTDAERALARRIMARIAARAPRRRSRRTRPVRTRGEIHDVRRTLRASLRFQGEPIERRFRQRTTRPRPLVLVCDVSGSMAPYARMLLQYLQASVAARRRVEAFVFGTRLTRVTRELDGRNPDRALERAAAAVVDWSGGTRIGASLAELNREHGGRVGRGAVVVVLSDGWDRGEPEELAEEMARLRRCAHRVIWLNPLKADPRYEPLTRGMQAALPHVDEFLAGNSLASLAQLADLMEGDKT
ncbi:MAG: vWA domain-containing protein [Thermoleophilaceae bacterium]